MVTDDLNLTKPDLTTMVRMDLALPMLLRPEPGLDDDAPMSVSRRLRPFRFERTREGAIGAQVAWLIDPVEESVSVYRPGEVVETLERPEAVTGSGPVEGFVLTTATLWNDAVHED